MDVWVVVGQLLCGLIKCGTGWWVGGACCGATVQTDVGNLMLVSINLVVVGGIVVVDTVGLVVVVVGEWLVSVGNDVVLG